MWHFCGYGWPSVEEFHAVFRVMHAREGDGTVTILGHHFGAVVEDLPASSGREWRKKCFLVSGEWHLGGAEYPVPEAFQAINPGPPDPVEMLSPLEKRRITKFVSTWPRGRRSSYRLIRWAVLEATGIGRRPGSPPILGFLAPSDNA